MSSPLGSLSVPEFLKRHWQKRPLLVRDSGLRLPQHPTPDELASLACDEEVASRLVLGDGERASTEVRHGPFDESMFGDLPGRNWTLLVQGVDRHHREVAQLLERFRFIPNWRIDDVMISYAAPGGGVGAHRDRYDVFLLQGEGLRRWGYDLEAASPDSGTLDGALAVPDGYRTRVRETLEPGDLLYLPPGVVHDGVAIEPSITYSIGFRAPSYRDLAAEVFSHAVASVDANELFVDPDRTVRDEPGLIEEEALARMRERLRASLGNDSALDGWIARYVTEPVREADQPPAGPGVTAASLSALLEGGGRLRRRAIGGLAWLPGPGDGERLFADGREYALDAGVCGLAGLICGTEALNAAAFAPFRDRPAVYELLRLWIAEGHLEPDD